MKFDILKLLYQNLHLLFLVICFGVTFVNRKTIPLLYAKILPWFILLTLFVEIIAFILSDIYEQNNLWLYNNYGAIEFWFYTWVVQQNLSRKKTKKIILGIATGLLAVYLLNNFFGQGVKGFSSITYCLSCIFLILSCFYYFYELFEKPSKTTLLRQSAFWLCTAFMFYFTCTFPIYGLANFIYNIIPQLIRNNIVIFIEILNVFFYSLLSIAFICQSVTRKSSQYLSLAVS